MNIFKYLFNRKYRLFIRKIKDVQSSIWEYEFKVSKARAMRENAREGRDRSVENIARLDAAIKGADKETKVKLELDKKAHEENVGKYEGQMKMIDDQIRGSQETQGLNELITGLAELREMYKEFIKTI